MPTSVMWMELTAEELRAKAAADAIVILPVASIEQHGPHLPTGVDTVLCEGVCKAGAEMAAEGMEVVVAPTLWCGLAEHHMSFGGTFTLDVPTYLSVLLSLLKSVERHGFRRVLIVNGHGGNIAALNAFLPDLARQTGLAIRAATYFDLAPDIAPVLEDQRIAHHACEVETSMMMALAPETVRLQRLPEAFGGVAEKGKAEGWYAQPARHRSFADFTPSGVNGDARRASRGKGETLLHLCAQGLADTLRDAKTWA